MEKIIQIAVTGPESTGKSALAGQLARHYGTVFVPEYARQYVTHLKRKYKPGDILTIAKRQMILEQLQLRKANHLLISDTELLVAKIWCEHAFGFCPEWIIRNLKEQPYDLYLLMNIDLPWEPDPLREHPHLRTYFFELYRNELLRLGRNFRIVSGTGQERLENAIRIVDECVRSLNAD